MGSSRMRLSSSDDERLLSIVFVSWSLEEDREDTYASSIMPRQRRSTPTTARGVDFGESLKTTRLDTKEIMAITPAQVD